MSAQVEITAMVGLRKGLTSTLIADAVTTRVAAAYSQAKAVRIASLPRLRG
jgi:hypothetical protein